MILPKPVSQAWIKADQQQNSGPGKSQNKTFPSAGHIGENNTEINAFHIIEMFQVLLALHFNSVKTF